MKLKMFVTWKKSYDQPTQQTLHMLLKSRDITLPTTVCLVKAMVFPVVMYGCESWTIKKAESQRIDDFELWCWRRPLRVPWTARRSNQFSSVQFSRSVVSDSAMLWTVARQASLSNTNCQSLLKLMSIVSVMPSISSSVVPFSSHLQFFPTSGSFPMSRLLA